MQINKTTKIIVFITTCLAVGYFSSMATMSSVKTWFPTVTKPFFNPPSWVFGPVWSMLYVMMGVAAGLVWAKIDSNQEVVKKALLFFGIQLALNALWSILFFGLQNPFLALIEIVLLWLLIFETFSQFKKIDKIAGFLLLPYLAWVGFASILNGSIWWLNR